MSKQEALILSAKSIAKNSINLYLHENNIFLTQQQLDTLVELCVSPVTHVNMRDAERAAMVLAKQMMVSTIDTYLGVASKYGSDIVDKSEGNQP